mgnify:CR=1 FL=1
MDGLITENEYDPNNRFEIHFAPADIPEAEISNIEWEFKLGGMNYFDAGYSGQQTDDSGYIFTGEGRDGLFLLKTDPEGHY